MLSPVMLIIKQHLVTHSCKLGKLLFREIHMKSKVNTSILFLLTALMIAGCSSAPAPQHDPYNDADSQRSRADKAQDEMSR
jgi:hypothetical protein